MTKQTLVYQWGGCYTTIVLCRRLRVLLPAVLEFLRSAPACWVWVNLASKWPVPTPASTMRDCVHTNTTLPPSASSLFTPHCGRRRPGAPVSGFLSFLKDVYPFFPPGQVKFDKCQRLTGSSRVKCQTNHPSDQRVYFPSKSRSNLDLK